MIKEYRKVATIKAEQFDGSDEMIDKYDILRDKNYGLPDDIWYVINRNTEDEVNLQVGDWIAIGTNGEHRIIMNNIFNKMYEEAKENEDVYIGDNKYLNSYEEVQKAGESLRKVLKYMIKPERCGYCDFSGSKGTGYVESSKYFSGGYCDAVIIRANSKIADDSYLPNYAKTNKTYLMVEGDGVDINEISFCPMCGRKLNEI